MLGLPLSPRRGVAIFPRKALPTQPRLHNRGGKTLISRPPPARIPTHGSSGHDGPRGRPGLPAVQWNPRKNAGVSHAVPRCLSSWGKDRDAKIPHPAGRQVFRNGHGAPQSFSTIVMIKKRATKIIFPARASRPHGIFSHSMIGCHRFHASFIFHAYPIATGKFS